MTTGNEIIGDHYEGYESARRLHEMMEHFDRFSDLKAHIGADVAREAFKRRPCVRKLRYIGTEPGREADSSDAADYFVQGELYTSIDFNGATYSMAGYQDGERVIGFTYFEWVK